MNERSACSPAPRRPTPERIHAIKLASPSSTINNVPNALSLSSTIFNENITAGSAVATLSSTDPDSGDTFTYALVAGTGSTDNAAFSIEGNQLKIKASPDFESKSSYSIRLQTKDSGGLTLEKTVTLNVSNLNEVPTALNLSSTSFNENITAGSAVATLSSTDPDSGDTFSYALVAGTGSTDNAAFTIDGNQLKIKASPDFESKSSYSIRLQTKDSGGLTLEKAVMLNVADLYDSPIIRGNSLYTIVPGPSWTQAEANSAKLGGHLTSINSQSENDWLYIVFGDSLWIGFSDNEREGQWKWSDGSEVAFINWTPDSPNNEAGIQHYAWMWTGRQGQWDDNINYAPPDVSSGIAEIPFIRRGDSAYVIVEGPTWEEAEANAVALGGHLVTINDAAENAWLLTNGYTTQPKWIGLADKRVEGTWEWSDNSSSAYKNWSLGQPDNSRASNTSEGQDYAVIGANGSWDDGENSLWNGISPLRKL